MGPDTAAPAAGIKIRLFAAKVGNELKAVDKGMVMPAAYVRGHNRLCGPSEEAATFVTVEGYFTVVP